MSNTQPLTVAQSIEDRLRFTQGDRLSKALRATDMTSQDMADYLGMSRNAVSNWLNDRSKPKLLVLRAWALRTGVPLTWLQTGQLPDLDSNQEPAG